MALQENERQFSLAVDSYYVKYCCNIDFFKPENDKKNQFFSKAKNFLKSIDELKSLFTAEHEKLLDDLLNAATELLRKPLENSDQLREHIDILKDIIKTRKTLKCWNGGYSVAVNSVFTGIGVTLTAIGFIGLYQSIVSFVAGTFLLASGPWGWLAFCVGACLVGLFIAGSSAANACKNYRYNNEIQIQEIEEFANFLLNPDYVELTERSEDNFVQKSF